MGLLSERKILFVVSQLKVGGAAKMIKYVSNLCTHYFDQVDLVTYTDDYTPEDVSSDVNRFNLEVHVNSWQMWRLPAIIKLRNLIKKRNPDIVCSFLPDISLMSLLACKGLSIKIVSAERGDPYVFSPLWKYLMEYTYSHSDATIFQLEGARDFFSNKVRNRSCVIPNPYIPIAGITPYCGKRKKTIVSAGRFAPQKRYDILLKAYSIVKAKHPEYKLILYGEGPLIDDYRKIARELNVQDDIIFPGYVTPVVKAIREDGIFVLSSDYEGIPNSLLEAMSMGMPTVSTNCTPGGPAFLTNNGERGVLIPKGDVTRLADALCKIIEDEQYAKELGNRAVGIVSQLDEQKISNSWIELFEQLLR